MRYSTMLILVMVPDFDNDIVRFFFLDRNHPLGLFTCSVSSDALVSVDLLGRIWHLIVILIMAFIFYFENICRDISGTKLCIVVQGCMAFSESSSLDSIQKSRQTAKSL